MNIRLANNGREAPKFYRVTRLTIVQAPDGYIRNRFSFAGGVPQYNRHTGTQYAPFALGPGYEIHVRPGGVWILAPGNHTVARRIQSPQIVDGANLEEIPVGRGCQYLAG